MSATRIQGAGRRPLYRWEFETLANTGAFGDEQVELLDGQLYYASEVGPPHADAQTRLARLLFEAIPAGEGEIRVGLPFALSDLSQPHPDFLVASPAQSYRAAHPRTASLVVEVSDSSRARDLGLKAALYAAGGVPDYWVVDLTSNMVVVHRDPAPTTFRMVMSHADGTVRALHHPGLVVDVAGLFG